MPMRKLLSIAVIGASGRMGSALIGAVVDDPGLGLSAAVSRVDDPAVGQDAGVLVGRPPLNIVLSTDFSKAVRSCDVAVDFSRPDGTLETLRACVDVGRPLVIGTTGFDAVQQYAIDAAASKIPVCQAANYSIGVNVCLKLLDEAARALGPVYDVEIVEAHHRHKVDAPSGTALAMGRTVADALGRDLDEVSIYGRQGHTGGRDGQTIGFSTVRGGDVVGDHTVMFLGDGERVEISHRATSRLNFARGALRAAAWLKSQPAGHYDMQDVLDLR